MDFGFLSEYSQYFIDGTKVTIGLSAITLILGFILGIVVCLFKISKSKILRVIANVYIEFIRCTPLLIQISIVYFGLPGLGIEFPSIGPLSSEFVAAIFTLSINSSAYIAEILRSGIQSVDKGQMEASRSLGFSYFMSMRYIIIPQGLKNSLPSLINEFISLIKESAIVSVIGIPDLMYKADTVRGVTYLAFEPLIVAALIYFVLTFSLSKLVGLLEYKLHNKTPKSTEAFSKSSEVADVA